MTPSANIAAATTLMAAFAERTGLDSDAAPQRYLWTDAFAVCNFHALAEAGGEARFRELALRTIDQVHRELGQHRGDDTRSGWLQGPNGTADAEHPTRAGLRIGKPLPERGIGEGIDERLEWEREGQYFHYLTRWMHALDHLARATGTPRFNLWARELADTAHRAFTHTSSSGAPRMYWKMSTDLSRPLVHSMGQHDPLDGYITVLALQRTAALLGIEEGPDLRDAAADYAALIEAGGWSTDDPLGLGGLLMDAFRIEQLMRDGGIDERALLNRILESALLGLRHYAPPHDTTAAYRLGFRELGLAIGLAAIDLMSHAAEDGGFGGDATSRRLLVSLREYVPLREAINAFWLQPANRRGPSWTEHRDINEVMLATSLVPEGWLVLPPVRRN